jgi:hypothetical protein
MTEEKALNKKCCFQFNDQLGEFNYCITSDCMGWKGTDHNEGYCVRLTGEQCRCSEKEMTSDINQAEIRA